jgi:uncharacterized OB-fold protein
VSAASPLEHGDGPPRLEAGRCAGCGEVTFPLRARCPACGGEEERVLLPPRGTLWTWTTQGFEPPMPPYLPDADGDGFAPYAVGYVEFDGLLRVEGRLTEPDPERLQIGMPMEVVALARANHVTFAFAPVDE